MAYYSNLLVKLGLGWAYQPLMYAFHFTLSPDKINYHVVGVSYLVEKRVREWGYQDDFDSIDIALLLLSCVHILK